MENHNNNRKKKGCIVTFLLKKQKLTIDQTLSIVFVSLMEITEVGIFLAKNKIKNKIKEIEGNASRQRKHR